MRNSLILWIVGLAVVLFGSISLNAQQQKQVEKQTKAIDLGKRLVERPVEKLIADSAKPPVLDSSKEETESLLKSLVDQGAPKELKDRGKSLIERPIEETLKGLSIDLLNQKPKIDPLKEYASKSAIEAPTELLIKNVPLVPLVTPAKQRSVDETSKNSDGPGNPKVKPGLVNWHADFETACAASKKSGKPVLLFHLLGQLDQRFT